MDTKPPPITPLEMTEDQIEFAEKIANRLGYTLYAYTSSSALWGLFCLPDRASHKCGCVILTKEFGFLFVQDLEDCKLHDLCDEEQKTYPAQSLIVQALKQEERCKA